MDRSSLKPEQKRFFGFVGVILAKEVVGDFWFGCHPESSSFAICSFNQKEEVSFEGDFEQRSRVKVLRGAVVEELHWLGLGVVGCQQEPGSLLFTQRYFMGVFFGEGLQFEEGELVNRFGVSLRLVLAQPSFEIAHVFNCVVSEQNALDMEEEASDKLVGVGQILLLGTGARDEYLGLLAVLVIEAVEINTCREWMQFDYYVEYAVEMNFAEERLQLAVGQA